MYGGVLDSILLATGDVDSVAVARCLRAEDLMSDVAAYYMGSEQLDLTAWNVVLPCQ